MSEQSRRTAGEGSVGNAVGIFFFFFFFNESTRGRRSRKLKLFIFPFVRGQQQVARKGEYFSGSREF